MRLSFVFTFALVCLSTGVAIAKGGDLVCRARVFAVSKEIAASLLDDPKLGGDASAALAKLQQMATSGQAEVVANPTTRTPVPGRATVKGLVGLDMEVAASETGRLKIHALIEQGDGQQKTYFNTNTEIERGKTTFLGTLEPKGEAAQTWLVFLHAQ